MIEVEMQKAQRLQCKREACIQILRSIASVVLEMIAGEERMHTRLRENDSWRFKRRQGTDKQAIRTQT
jgi:hypothetical protein